MNRRNALRLLATALLAPAGAKVLFAAASEAEAKRAMADTAALLGYGPDGRIVGLDGITGGERGKYGYTSLEEFNAWQLEVNNLMRAALDRKTPLMRLFDGEAT